VSRELNIILATVGKVALSRGTRNPPCWFIRRSLVEIGTRLSASARSGTLNFRNLFFWQAFCFRLSFRTFRTHSL